MRKKALSKTPMTVWRVLIYLFLFLFMAASLFPLLYEVLLSVSSRDDFLNARFLVFPHHFNLEMYKLILFQDSIGRSFLISIVVTITSTLYSMLLLSFGAYALIKENLPGKKIFFTLLLITMFFGGGLIPTVLTLRSLHLTDSYLGLILPFGISAFNIILLRNFFAQVPRSVMESCRIDGANDFRCLFQFLLPLSKAGLATISVFTIVGKWNDWYWPMVLLSDERMYPLAYQVKMALSATGDNLEAGIIDMTKVFAEGRNGAIIVISLLPIAIVFIALQKYFVQGVMLGAVKS